MIELWIDYWLSFLLYFQGCPAISVYTEANLDKALDMAAKAFCQSEVKMQSAANVIILSQIFQWYRQDFGETDVDVVRYVKLKGKTF